MKRTPLYDEHIRAGARMVPFAGFEMPVQYEGVTAEHMNVRRRAGLFDVSHMGNFMVTGPDAGAFLQSVTSNDVSKLYPGKVQYSTITNDQGGIVDDLLVYQLDDDRYMLVVNAANIEKDFRHLEEKLKQSAADARMENVSDDLAIIAVQGPLAPAIMDKLTTEPVSGMKFYTHRKVSLAGLDDILLSTTGYTGEKGYEIYAPADKAATIWRRLMKAGKDEGLQPAGLGARDTLRLEKGYCLYGNDIDDTTTPLEAGLGWITKLHTDFTGVEVLRRQKEEGIKRRLVGFLMEGKGIPRHGYDIVDGQGKIIGKVTSGTMSPVLRQGLGMGYVPVAFAKEGTPVWIRVRNKDLPAKIIKMPAV